MSGPTRDYRWEVDTRIFAIRIPRQLAADLELCAQERILTGRWTVESIVALYDLVRLDLVQGPDLQPRTIARLDGTELDVPCLERVEDRLASWSDLFASEAALIRNLRTVTGERPQ